MKMYNYFHLVLCDCFNSTIKHNQKRTTDSLHMTGLAYLNSVHATMLSAGQIICFTCWSTAYKYGKVVTSLSVLEQELHDMQNGGSTCTNNEDTPSYSLISTYLHIVSLLKNQRTTLLKDVYQYYWSKVGSQFGNDPLLCLNEKKTCKWLLSAVVLQFGKLGSCSYNKDRRSSKFQNGHYVGVCHG